MDTGETGAGLPRQLDEADLDEIRSIAVEALAEMGKRAVRIAPDSLVLDDGGQFLLEDVALACSYVERSEWPAVAAHYARAMAAPSALGSAGLCEQEFLDVTRARIVGPEAFDEVAQAHGYARRLVPDRPETSPLVVLCHDLPHAVITLGDLHLKDRDHDAVWAAGLQNTAAEPVQNHDVLEQDDAQVEVLRGDSLFTAAKALDFPALLSGRSAEHGVVFAIPFQQILLLHLPRNAAETATSLNILAHLADEWHEQAAKPISPEVFYWQDGVYQQLTTHNARGEIAVHVEGRFFDALNALADARD
ncbi:hypothetical protein Srot_2033 [Segniliparus rotundus DSM 44985]|uniref:Uncharacterized protein n=1 Tax=Segniliparus rotundus (strain ATCC BAA-972 / CDC 1076 / CIP 108378 / DSM 44985 / JCM 13578) TaxID=640132 RepID=D6Z959_SEGRD|nr:hypothetical protein [Segniliparus rotundus]ADG98489.1 hypothetical protein Srot_2033 [Segniliparus rotundus DSM 44985]